MNDEELDPMLDAWTLAPPLPSLRERMRLGFPGPSWREKMLRFVPSGIGKFAFGGGVVTAVLLLVAALGFPQPSKTFAAMAGIRFTVDSESTNYDEDGTPTTLEITWYEFRGAPIVPAMSKPGHPLWTMTTHAINAVGFAVVHIAPSLVTPRETEVIKIPHDAFVRAGCVTSGDTVLGYETIASHRTVKVFGEVHATAGWDLSAKTVRFTEWRAPDLGCFPMGDTVEASYANGSTRLVASERALRVNWIQ